MDLIIWSKNTAFCQNLTNTKDKFVLRNWLCQQHSQASWRHLSRFDWINELIVWLLMDVHEPKWSNNLYHFVEYTKSQRKIIKVNNDDDIYIYDTNWS